MLAHAALIPFETAESVALTTGTSGITVGRFLRKLGIATGRCEKPARSLSAPGNERTPDSATAAPASDRLQHSLSLEVDAITHVYQLAQTDVFKQIVHQLTHAEAVFVLGIQSTRGIANAFFSHRNTCARA